MDILVMHSLVKVFNLPDLLRQRLIEIADMDILVMHSLVKAGDLAVAHGHGLVHIQYRDRLIFCPV